MNLLQNSILMENKDNAALRLRQFVMYAKREKLIKSIRQFEGICGLSNGYVNVYLRKDHGNLGSDNIGRIAKNFPMLNLYWLCTGEGEMLNYGSREREYKEVMDIISELQEAVKKLRTDNNK